jgi:hypothetical protein
MKENASKAITGTTVAIAVIALAERHASAGAVLAKTVATLLVYWAAHVYSEVVAQRQYGDRGLTGLLSSMRKNLPVLEAATLLVFFLLLSAVGVLDRHLAVNLALVTGIGQLAGWGIAGGRRCGWSWPGSLLAGTVDGTLGLIIVGLKVLVH